MTVFKYVAKFMELEHFGDDYVATYMAKVRKFEDCLKLSIGGKCGTSPTRHGLYGQDNYSHREKDR